MTKPTRERHSELLATLRGELNEFQVQFIAALNRPVVSAESAESADMLEGKTPAEIQALAMAEVTTHTNKLGVNVHGLDPHVIDTYNQQEYDASLDLMMDVDSGVPLDFYGDREFLPPAVTGSFESGSNATPYSGVAMLLEDNGTLMILRSGTDGDTAGVFYSYLRNAQTETDIEKNLVMSNVPYRPAYFPDGMSAKAVFNGNQDLIIGIMKNDVTGEHTGYFISMINGTMDQTKHTGIFVPNGNFLTVGKPQPAMYGVPFGFIKGNYAYILQDLRADGKIGHRVWRINRNELITGNFTAATQIKGWSINRGASGTVARDDIVLFDTVEDAVIKSGKSHLVWEPPNGNEMTVALKRDDGSVGILQAPYIQYAPTDNLTNVIDNHWYFVYEFDEVNKVIDVSKYWNNKIKSNYPASGDIVVTPGAGYIPREQFGYPRYRNRADTSSLYTTAYNQMWLWTSIAYASSDRTLLRFTYADGLDPVAILQGNVDPATAASAAPIGRYGSPVTSTYRMAGNLAENVLYCKNIGLLDGVSKLYWVRVGLSGQPTFQYSSVTGTYAFKGFAPTTDRKDEKTLKWSDDQLYRLVTEASPGVMKNHKGRFSSWFDEPTRAGDVNSNGVASGSIGFPTSLLRTLETQIEADLRAKGYKPYAGVVGRYLAFDVIIPQAYTDLPAFVYGTWANEDRYAYNFVYSLNISGTRQAVTGASIVTAGSAIAKFLASNATLTSLYALVDTGPVCLRRVNGGFAAALGESTNLGKVGDGCRPTYLATYTAATSTWSIVEDQIYWDYFTSTAPMGWFNFPNRGLYFGFSSEFVYGEVDCGSKLIATVACVNDMPIYGAATLRGRAMAPETGIILLSQRVVNAWTVYFSDDTPAMLDGYYREVKPYTHVMDSSAANKTFHVWLVREGDELVYRIVESSTAAPAGKSLYLGYFTTNDTGIAVIAVEKRVAVGGMMLSPDARGSAIPLTSGTPNNAGRLNWR